MERLTPDQYARQQLQRRVVDEMRARMGMRPVEWKPLREHRHVTA